MLAKLIENQLINVDIEHVWKHLVHDCLSKFWFGWVIFDYYKCVWLNASRDERQDQILSQSTRHCDRNIKKVNRFLAIKIFGGTKYFWMVKRLKNKSRFNQIWKSRMIGD